MAKILEVSRVAPLIDDSPQHFSLPLTFFDIFWLRSSPVERLFFYGFSEPNPSSFFFDSVLPKLKHSLSLTLPHFLPVAGTLTFLPSSSKPVVLFTENDAVSLTVAESDADFDELSGDHTREAASLYPLVSDLISSEDGTPVMSLKITLFPTKGFCIGVTNHHAVLDGRSVTMFVKSWAHMCRENRPLTLDLKPSYDRSVIRDPTGLDMLYLKQWSDALSGSNLVILSKSSGSDQFGLVRETLMLTRNDISKLREKILQGKELRLSSFVIAFSYFLLCIVRASEESGPKVLFGFGADFRSRVKPPIPANYFGNCIGVLISSEEVREVVASAGVAALAMLARRVDELIKGALEREDVLEGADEWLASHLSIIAMAAGTPTRAIGVAGSPTFGIYSVDFGWGRPRKVDIVSIDHSGAVSMAEGRDGDGGIELGVVLVRREMEIFTSLFGEGLK